METHSVQQEILLSTNSSLSKRQVFEKDSLDAARNLSHLEQLAAACWNGWLNEMLPGLIDTSDAGKNLYLWEITPAKYFLNIDLGEYPQAIDTSFSINPYLFLTPLCYG